MQLIYRGQAYTCPSSSATSEGEIAGKYRGVAFRRSVSNGFFRSTSPATLTYRGITYENLQ
jgi:hypothetical protein